MKRYVMWLITAAVIAGLGCTAPGTRGVQMDLNKELAAIQRMRDTDMRASKAKDFETLRTLFTADAVAMPPGAGFQRGSARDAAMKNAGEAMKNIEVLDYVEEFEETQFVRDLDGNLMAIEWGTIRGSSRDLSQPDAKANPSSYKVLRILKKEPDGEWKIHRTIYN
jgi:ketosteroid isomerase-like protein